MRINKFHRFIASILSLIILLSNIELPKVEAGFDSEDVWRSYVEGLGYPYQTPNGLIANRSTFNMYGQIVYGNPFGAYEYSPKPGKYEYQYLGYASDGVTPVTNTWFRDDAGGAEGDFNTYTYLTIAGAYDKWNDIRNDDVRYHMLTSRLSYDGVQYNVTPASIGLDKVLPLTMPGWKNGFSVRVEFLGSQGERRYATMIGPSMAAGGGTLQCIVETSQNTYTIPANKDSVTVPVSSRAQANVYGNYITPDQVSKIKVGFWSTSKEASGTFTLTNNVHNLTFTRASYGVGTHQINLQGSAELYSIFGDSYSALGSKTITLIVEPEIEPSLTVTSKSVSPEKTVYMSDSAVSDTNENISFSVQLSGVEASNIERWDFYARKDGSGTAEMLSLTGAAAQTLTPSISFTNNANLRISKNQILRDRQINQVYVINAKATFKEPVAGSTYIMLNQGDSLLASVSVAESADFIIVKDGLDVTDQSIKVPNETVSYSVTLQDRSTGSIIQREWSYKKEGESSWILADSGNSTSVSIPNLVPGNKYVFKLRLNSDDKYTAAHSLFVSKEPPPEEKPEPEEPGPDPDPSNKKPIASIKAPLYVYVGENVEVSGEESKDDDGTIESYEWTSTGAAGTIKGEKGTLVYNATGEYKIELTVTDNKGAKDTARHIIAVIAQEPPAPPNNPPNILLSAPPVVRAGELFYVFASVTDDEDEIIAVDFRVANQAPVIVYVNPPTKNASAYIQTKILKTGTYEIFVIGLDKRNGTCSARTSIRVVDPIPEAKIDVSGILKENRKVSVTSKNSSPISGSDYPIQSNLNKWTIEPLFPIESGKTMRDYVKDAGIPGIVYSTNKIEITGNVDFDLLFREQGSYKITLTVSNYYDLLDRWFTNTTSRIITIAEDVSPVANITTTSIEYRKIDEYNNAVFNLLNTSYSMDGDILGCLKISYIYDANNDCIYGNSGESYTPVFELNDAEQIKQFEDYKLLLPNVGMYKIRIDVMEDISASVTIPSLLLPENYLSSYHEIVVEVENLAPNVSMSVVKKRKVELEFIFDETTGLSAQDVMSLYNAQTLPGLYANDIEVVQVTAKSANGFGEVTSEYPSTTIPYTYKNASLNVENYNPDWNKGIAAPYDLMFAISNVTGYGSVTYRNMIFSDFPRGNQYELRIVDLRDNTYKVVKKYNLASDLYECQLPKIWGYSNEQGYIYVFDDLNNQYYILDIADGSVVAYLPAIEAPSNYYYYTNSYTSIPYPYSSSSNFTYGNEDYFSYAQNEWGYGIQKKDGRKLYVFQTESVNFGLASIVDNILIEPDDILFFESSFTYYERNTEKLTTCRVYDPFTLELQWQNQITVVGTQRPNINYHVNRYIKTNDFILEGNTYKKGFNVEVRNISNNALVYSKQYIYSDAYRYAYDSNYSCYSIAYDVRLLYNGKLVVVSRWEFRYINTSWYPVLFYSYDVNGNLVNNSRLADSDSDSIWRITGVAHDYVMLGHVRMSVYGEAKFYNTSTGNFTNFSAIPKPAGSSNVPYGILTFYKFGNDVFIYCGGAGYNTSESYYEDEYGAYYERYLEYSSSGYLIKCTNDSYQILTYNSGYSGSDNIGYNESYDYNSYLYGIIYDSHSAYNEYGYVWADIYGEKDYWGNFRYFIPAIIRKFYRDQGLFFKREWASNVEHVAVVISKKDNLNDVVSSRNLKTALTNNIKVVEIVLPSTAAQVSNHANLLNGNAAYIDATNYNAAFATLKNVIVGPQNQNPSMVFYGVVGDEFSISPIYQDPEGDDKNAEVWIITHDPTSFNGQPIDNPMPVMPETGMELSAPPTTFTSAGTFQIIYKAQDKPVESSDFDNYKYWSAPEKAKAILHVHRKPVAQFKITVTQSGADYNISVSDPGLSYDPDHI